MTQQIGQKPANSAARTSLRQPFQVRLLGGTLLRGAYRLSFIAHEKKPSMRTYTLTLRVTPTDLSHKLREIFQLSQERSLAIAGCFPRVVTFDALSHDQAFTMLKDKIQGKVKIKLGIDG